MRINDENFVCPKCMNVFPKKNATKSGDNGCEYASMFIVRNADLSFRTINNLMQKAA